jgi:short-subunit dehydrogenase
MSYNWQEKRVWVIGASSGIGAAFAQAVTKRGATVAISARKAADLETVSAGKMKVLPLDITDVAGVQSAADSLNAEWGRIDVVVILAGYWQRMSAVDFDLVEFTRHIETNVVGMGNCVAAVLPKMLAAKSGLIVGVSSVAGYRGMPGAEGYGASKAAQLNFLETMRTGLQGTGVDVQTVSPGFVKTPMTDTNEFPMPFLITAEQAAEYMVKGIERNKAEVVFPFGMMVAMKALNLTPQSLWPKLFKPRGKKQK